MALGVGVPSWLSSNSRASSGGGGASRGTGSGWGGGTDGWNENKPISPYQIPNPEALGPQAWQHWGTSTPGGISYDPTKITSTSSMSRAVNHESNWNSTPQMNVTRSTPPANTTNGYGRPFHPAGQHHQGVRPVPRGQPEWDPIRRDRSHQPGCPPLRPVQQPVQPQRRVRPAAPLAREPTGSRPGADRRPRRTPQRPGAQPQRAVRVLEPRRRPPPQGR